jgi:hypothetical protein
VSFNSSSIFMNLRFKTSRFLPYFSLKNSQKSVVL